MEGTLRHKWTERHASAPEPRTDAPAEKIGAGRRVCGGARRYVTVNQWRCYIARHASVLSPRLLLGPIACSSPVPGAPTLDHTCSRTAFATWRGSVPSRRVNTSPRFPSLYVPRFFCAGLRAGSDRCSLPCLAPTAWCTPPCRHRGIVCLVMRTATVWRIRRYRDVRLATVVDRVPRRYSVFLRGDRVQGLDPNAMTR